jgi:hypothetical protein
MLAKIEEYLDEIIVNTLYVSSSWLWSETEKTTVVFFALDWKWFEGGGSIMKNRKKGIKKGQVTMNGEEQEEKGGELSC